MLSVFFNKMDKKDIKKIKELRKLFPSEICVSVIRSEDGKFCAEIKNYLNCFTEASSFSELIEMINDAVRTYFEIPKKYISFMPNYFPSIETAQKFNIFPLQEKQQDLVFLDGK